MTPLAHGPRRLSPARAGASYSLDDETSWLGAELDLIGYLCLIQEDFGDPDAP